MRKFAVLGMLAVVGSFDRALAQPAFTVTSSSVSFSQTVNGAAPAPQIVTVSSTGAPISFAVSITYNQGQNWLAVAPSTAVTPNASLTLTANGAGLPAGTYTAQVIVSSPGINSQAISVTLAVSSGSLGFVGSLAHLASAGLWKTTYTLVNDGATAAQTHVSFYDDSGNPLALPLTFTQTSTSPQPPATSFDATINPGAILIVETTGPDSQTTQTGWAQLSANGSVGAFAVFRQAVNGAIPEAVVPLETRNAGSYLLAFDTTGGYAMGVAIANISTQAGTIGIVIRDDNGTILQSNTLTLAGLGHSSFDLVARYPIAGQRRGTVEFQTPSAGQLSVLGLRFSPTTAFTTVPPITK